MANLERMSSAQRLDLCRKYFFIGLGFVPLVWLVNCIWFYKYGFCSQTSNTEESKSIKKYLILSMIGLGIWSILIPVWIAVYSTSRVDRADWAEWLTFIVPLGRV